MHGTSDAGAQRHQKIHKECGGGTESGVKCAVGPEWAGGIVGTMALITENVPGLNGLILRVD